jgi:murein DD-endopeptidase MepM/ murein hydrolase activator NlpD
MRAIESPRRSCHRHSTAFVLTLLVALLAHPSNAESTPAAEKVRAWVDESIRDRGFDLLAAEVERIKREAVERHALGYSPESLRDWLMQASNEVILSFAKPFARHDDSARYRLPYDPHIPRLVSQGVGGRKTHKGQDHYAFDFLMPIGAPVLAARDGVVACVRDKFSIGDTALGKHNVVFVLHADGTFASYGHLAPDVEVVHGQSVTAGTRLGRSGDTGSPEGPHLHFEVHRLEAPGEWKSLPIRFRLGGQDFVPKEKEYWGAPPKPTIELRASVDGKPADAATRIPLRPGASVKLGVQALLRSGEVRDVTRDPKTHFESLTLWSMSVEGSGRAAANPSKGFEKAAVDGDLVRMGTVGIFHGGPGDRRRGFALVEFEVVP